MKRMKKCFSVLLAVVLLLSAAPLAGFVGIEMPQRHLPDFDFNLSADAATIVKSGSCGENLTYTLDSDGVLTIAGTGEMENYNSWDNYSPWYSNHSAIKTVSIENGVTSIGWYAFHYCTSLTSVTIPESVTSIGNSAFEDCTSLTVVHISDIAAWCNIDFDGYWANPLYYAHNLYLNGTLVTKLTIPDSVTSIWSSAFEYCTSLISVTIPDSVTSIGSRAFYDCTKLTSVTIPDSVTSIGEYAFYDCTSLTSVPIGNNVTKIGNNAFKNTSYYNNKSNWINSVFYIGNYLIEADKKIAGAYEIKSDTKLIGDGAFSNCTTLTSITIPDSVTSIGSYAFYYCSKLTSVTIPDSVTSIGDCAFCGCTSLTDITVDADNTTYCSEDGVLFNKSKTELIQYPVGNARTSYTIPDSVTSIGYSAFSDCTKLTSVTIPDSVTSIGDWAFSGCTKLTSATIPDSVTSIGNDAFYDCTKLTSVTIPDSVTSIGYCTFCNCTSLTSVTIGDSVTSIGNDAFRNCTSLTSVTIGNSVTSIEWCAFEDCTSLTSVTIPDSVTSIGSYAFYNCPALVIRGYLDSYAQQYAESNDIPFIALNAEPFVNLSGSCGTNVTYTLDSDGVLTVSGTGEMDDYSSDYSPWYSNRSAIKTVIIENGVTSIGSYAFYDCISLTSVSIGNSVTSIGWSAFSRCTKLTSVTIGDSVTSIGGRAFFDCTKLTSVTIPDSVTSIGDCAFYNCTKLTSVTIPDSVTSIGWSAFEYCTSLTSVTIPDSVTSIGEYAFRYCASLTDITVDADNTAYCSEDGVLFNKSKTELIQYPVGNARTSYTIPDSVTSIWSSAFEYCTSLISVTIPDSVKSIGNYAFRDCTSLTSVTIPDSVTSIGDYVFYNCTSLTSVTIIGDSVTSIGDWAFYDCTKLTSVTIPDSVTSIGHSAFRECTSLTSVTIPDSVTSIGNTAFRECTSLTSVTIPDSVTSIGYYAFYDCTSLIDITVDADNTAYCSEDGVLFNKSKTELIQYPVGNARTSYTIPDSVTSIGHWSFYNCTSLTSVTIPDSVTSIGIAAFYNCPALVIRGYLDSYAQQYAEEIDIPFIALNTEPLVKLSGTSVTPTAEFTVYGLATPLQAVSLYCEDAVIGTATAGGNGRYTLTATLPAPEEGKTYTVVAKVTVDEVTKESEPLQVTYNSDSATLNSLVFTHSCYDYTITSETLNFVAPIISINSGLPMYFTITLNGKTPDTLTVVSTKNGVRKTMPATYNAADGKWYASGWFDTANKSYVPGEITLEYDDGKVIEVPFKAIFIVDPSGYVYEAVKSNVVEDAVAIVQYKDENGNAAFWDANAYDQVNPQITKADGYFSWFVPEGEWQVKIVKDGYQTALSDWYTVPPEVTGLYIPLVTTSSAWVDYCNVFADYAEIKFSQYMQIDSINSTNITFGEYTGTWEAVDKEVSGTDENVYYATTFRFTPDIAFSGDITVNVANVKSYAGKSTSYTETVTVTAPIENFTLSATELTLAAGTQATVELDAGAAAAGKTVSAQFGNEAVASAVKTVTLDENGKASLTVNGNAFGATTATFALAGTSLTAECTVTVTAPTAVEPAFKIGDVDGDKAITASDARLALRASVKLETLSAAQMQAANVDNEEGVSASDARLILRVAVKLDSFE